MTTADLDEPTAPIRTDAPIVESEPNAPCPTCGNPRGQSEANPHGVEAVDSGQAAHGGIPDPQVHYYRELHCAYQDHRDGPGPRLVSVVVGERVALAADPTCPPGFMLLLSDDEPVVQEALAGNPALTLRIMKRLARAGGSPALVLARRRVVTPEVLAIIADVATRRRGTAFWFQPDVHTEALKAVLGRGDCPPEVLADHARRDSFNQGLVAGNPHCPPAILDYLAARGGWDAMANIADHPRATAPMLSNIVARTRPHGRHPLAHETLLRLISVDWRRARGFVLHSRASHRQQLVRDSVPARGLMVADPDWRLRYAVAVATPEADLLRDLAADPHGRVRRAASQRLLRLLAG